MKIKQKEEEREGNFGRLTCVENCGGERSSTGAARGKAVPRLEEEELLADRSSAGGALPQLGSGGVRSGAHRCSGRQRRRQRLFQWPGHSMEGVAPRARYCGSVPGVCARWRGAGGTTVYVGLARPERSGAGGAQRKGYDVRRRTPRVLVSRQLVEVVPDLDGSGRTPDRGFLQGQRR
ncbi:spidroin-1-like [Iris pallida]|uniref:Spidroin-1-like n=1 Tax=Iris pallida TaxID=29817 RepID=A0AAX6EJF9_IRIPA|nr:spidroin-1-like [Iris pallida]